MAIFIEKEEYEFLLRIEKFCENIDTYAHLLGLDPVDVHNFKTDNQLFNYVFSSLERYGTMADSFTKYKISNLQVKFSELMSACKYSKNYTTQIGDLLGINAQVTSLNPESYTPALSVHYTADGYPVLKWNKGMFHSVEIWKNAGSVAGYQKLARCQGSEYVDRSSLPISLNEWKYSIIYVFKDEMVGNWSEEINVLVQQNNFSSSAGSFE